VDINSWQTKPLWVLQGYKKVFISFNKHFGDKFFCNNKQLLDEAEQNIVICQWRADQLFANAEIFSQKSQKFHTLMAYLPAFEFEL